LIVDPGTRKGTLKLVGGICAVKSFKLPRHSGVIFALAIAIGASAALMAPYNKHTEQPASPAVHETLPAVPVIPAPSSAKTQRTANVFPAKNDPLPKPYEYVKFPQAPAFVETAEGHYAAQTSRYDATLSDADGMAYRPKHKDAEGTQIRVRLQKVSRGEAVIYDRAADTDAEELVDEGLDGMSFWRAVGFEEHYKPRGDGVEQSFLLDNAPEGSGDLAFSVALDLKGVIPLPRRSMRNGGISFVTPQGKMAARYGQVVVRDSAGDGCVVEPRLSADARSITFAVPENFLATACYPVEIDPLVGGEQFLNTDLPTLVGPPTIGASTTSYLVVWTDYRAANNVPQLFASIVSASGLPTVDFPISSPLGIPLDYRFQRVSIASDGTNWLVVWADDRQAGAGIRGSIVMPNGSVLDGDDFLIGPTTGTVIEDPLVCYNGVEYVVAWQDTPSTGGVAQVKFTRVTGAKVVGLASEVPAGVAPINQALLFLVPQRPSGDTLLIYRENNELPLATRSVRMAQDGTLRDPGGTTLFTELPTEGGFGRPIGAVFSGTEWQILSSYDQTTDSSVYAHRLSTTGVVTPPTTVFAEVGVGPAGQTGENYAPAFAGNGEWLFIRNEKVSNSEYHLLAKRVTFAGVDRDPVPFQIDTAVTGVLRNSVAALVGSTYLVAWLDGRGGGAQPGDARDIASALVDSTFASPTGTALVAVASASPTSGEGPLQVNFDANASLGAYDALAWDFGDGTGSTTATVSHTYRNNGTYNAILRLTKGAYNVYDRVVIRVGVGGNSPTDGVQVGVPVDNSAGLETKIFISAATIRLDFLIPTRDTARMIMVLDSGRLPEALTGLPATITIGTKEFTFSLDAKGQAATAENQFVLNPVNGVLAVQLLNTDLRDALAALGAKNETNKPPIIVEIPIGVTIGSFSASAKVGANYRSTVDDVGVASYGFLGDGKEVSGAFLIRKFTAVQGELGKRDVRSHTYNIQGQVVKPNGGLFKPAATGEFRFLIGETFVVLPVGLFQSKDGGKIKFTSRAKTFGLKKFIMDLNSGKFTMQLLKVPAEGEGKSGLPLAKSGDNITLVDLNLSFIFDLADGKLSAGRYVFIARKDASSKNWKLR
jgi:hypothetical protein